MDDRLRMMRWRVLTGLLTGLLVAGCESHEPQNAVAPLPVIEGSGVIRGQVVFSGTPPVMKSINNRACHDGAPEELSEEFVIVNDNGTLRNVFVYLEGAPASAGPDEPVPVLDQVHCRYEPHVVGVRVGQDLLIRSSDPTLHNVHWIASRNRSANFGMTGAGQERAVRFTAAEFITVKCDVHPWMTGHIGVFDNPWFAITGETGEFEITGVPAGSYKLVTWHEQYGRREQAIAVGEGATLDAEFEYRQDS
jgi:plastocyanin